MSASSSTTWFHQTLFRYLDKQPLAETLAELQAHVDTFDCIYNTDRPHQALPGRITPQAAWEATPKAEAPRPEQNRPAWLQRPVTNRYRTEPALAPSDLPADTHAKTLTSAGSFMLDAVHYMVGGQHRFQQVLVVTDGEKITVTDLHGEILVEHTRPAPGTRYVGNGRPRGPQPKTPDVSPKS
jgi:hypothetical protein